MSKTERTLDGPPTNMNGYLDRVVGAVEVGTIGPLRSALELEPRAGRRVDHVDPRCQAGASRVDGHDTLIQGRDRIAVHENDRAPPEAGAGHARSGNAGHRGHDLHERVELGRDDLVIVAE